MAASAPWWAGFAGAARPLHDRGRRPLVVLRYGRVVAGAGAGTDASGPQLAADEFAWQMQALAQRATPVALSQVSLYLRGRASFRGRPVVVSFDEATTGTVERVAPVLKALQIPAVFHLCPDAADHGTVPWRDQAAGLAMHAESLALDLGDGRLVIERGADVAVRRQAAARLCAELAGWPAERRRALLDPLLSSPVAAPAQPALQARRSIDWAAARTLVAAGCELGSATVDGVALAAMAPDELARQLVVSKQRIEERSEAPCLSVAYPDAADARTPRVLSEAGLAGYRLGLGQEPGANWIGALQPYALRRINIDASLSRRDFLARLDCPGWFA